MKKRTLVTIAVVVVVVAVVLAVFLLYSNQTVGIHYDATLTTSRGSTGAYLSMQLHPEKTLFNCQVTISYMAINGTSVSVTHQVGLVDLNPKNQYVDFELTDYTTGSTSAQTQFTQANPPDTLSISAQGFASP